MNNVSTLYLSLLWSLRQSQVQVSLVVWAVWGVWVVEVPSAGLPTLMVHFYEQLSETALENAD